MADLTVNVNKLVHGPIDKVFDAWLNPKMLSIFMLPMPGMPNSDVEIFLFDLQTSLFYIILLKIFLLLGL